MTGISIDAIISEILADNALRRRLGRSTPGLLTPDNREALAVTARAAAAQTAASAAPYITVVSDDGEIITIDTPESLSDAERGLTARLITHAAGAGHWPGYMQAAIRRWPPATHSRPRRANRSCSPCLSAQPPQGKSVRQ